MVESGELRGGGGVFVHRFRRLTQIFYLVGPSGERSGGAVVGGGR